GSHTPPTMTVRRGPGSSLAPGCSELDRFDDLDVPRAAAEVAGDGLAHVFVRRGQAGDEEPVRGDDHPRRADAALRPAAIEEALLHRRQLAASGDAFHCQHRRALDLADGDETGIDQLAVDQHRAGAALALAAAFFRAGEAEIFAQDVEQTFQRRRLETARDPVDGEFHDSTARMTRSGLNGRSGISLPVACNTAPTTAGAGPSIGSSPSPFAPYGPCGYGFSS